MTIINSKLLNEVMKIFREKRPSLKIDQPYYNRIEKSYGGNYVEVWFLTSGCQWDANGGCTMCNYGKGYQRTEDDIVYSVHQGLSAINIEVNELVVSPSGSMLDPQEVSPNALKRIYSLIHDFPAEYFLFETRSETITEDKIRELAESIPCKKLGVEIGIESSNEWVRRFCVNKGNLLNQFINAANILQKHNILTYANISLGTAFLSPIEAIYDTVDSIRWAFANGADICVLFPLHVKPYTLLAWLYQGLLYKPPSLWSLIEALRLIGNELMEKTEISWYRNYYDDESKVIASPTTCNRCQEEVLTLLDNYRNFRSPDIIYKLDKIKCECKDKWRESLKISPILPLPERVLGLYKRLSDDFLPDYWWSMYGEVLEYDLMNDFITI